MLLFLIKLWAVHLCSVVYFVYLDYWVIICMTCLGGEIHSTRTTTLSLRIFLVSIKMLSDQLRQRHWRVTDYIVHLFSGILICDGKCIPKILIWTKCLQFLAYLLQWLYLTCPRMPSENQYNLAGMWVGGYAWEGERESREKVSVNSIWMCCMTCSCSAFWSIEGTATAAQPLLQSFLFLCGVFLLVAIY